MDLSFSKYHGAGNDFILVDNRDGVVSISPDLVVFLCRRAFGVGADGVILAEKSDLADIRMRIFNADGSEAEMCGNGVRCLFRFLQDQKIIQQRLSLETMERLLDVWEEDGEVVVEMGAVTDIEWNCAIEGRRLHLFNTGVPHAVLFVDDVKSTDLESFAQLYCHHPAFPKGVNFNIASLDEQGLVMRTWERGVEAETFACGTGACAVALAAGKLFGLQPQISVRVASGDRLTISYAPDFSSVTLKGPAIRVFDGSFPLPSRQNLLAASSLVVAK